MRSPRLRVNRRAKKMIEANLADRRERCIRRNMPANIRIVLIRAYHHRRRIPANQTLDTALKCSIARKRQFFVRRNRVQVRSVDARRRRYTRLRRSVQQLFQ